MIVALLGATCRGPARPSPSKPVPSIIKTSPSPSPVPLIGRAAIIVMENKEYSAVIDHPETPFTNALARDHVLARKFYGITHPSLPNYLAMTGGSTFGVTSDCTGCNRSERNIVDQLEKAGISWKAYMQGLPSPCFRGASAGHYAKKHNPFIYYDSIAENPARCSKIVGLDELKADIAANQLPRFIWLTPDECSDSHSCGKDMGDAFLSQTVPPLLDALGPRGVLFLTYDEGSTNEGCCGVAKGGHIATILAGPAARQAYASDTEFQHYSILRTIEDAWGLPHLGEAGCQCTASMVDLLTQP